MAVLEFLKVSIVIDGGPCQEHDVELSQLANIEIIDLEQPHVTKLRTRTKKHASEKLEKYVEAVGGSYFEVKTAVSTAFDFRTGNAVVAEILFSGEYVEGTVHEEEDFDNDFVDGYSVMTCRGASLDSRKVMHRFRFADITTREGMPEDDIEELKTQHKDLGSIEVRFRRVRTSPPGRGADLHAKIPTLDDIPEKVVKGDAISMTASFGDGEEVGDCSRCDIEYTEHLPFATIFFKCRSKRDLQLLRVIPRSPSPVPLELRPVEELSLDEARELIKRQQEAAEATRLRIKHEATEVNLNDLRSLKHHRSYDAGSNSNEVEVVASRSKRQRLLPTAEDEVIDLLD